MKGTWEVSRHVLFSSHSRDTIFSVLIGHVIGLQVLPISSTVKAVSAAYIQLSVTFISSMGQTNFEYCKTHTFGCPSFCWFSLL